MGPAKLPMEVTKMVKSMAQKKQRQQTEQGELLGRRERWLMRNRRGAVSSMDYFLVLAIILPLVLIIFRFAPRMIQLVYEMTIVIVGGPTM